MDPATRQRLLEGDPSHTAKLVNFFSLDGRSLGVKGIRPKRNAAVFSPPLLAVPGRGDRKRGHLILMSCTMAVVNHSGDSRIRSAGVFLNPASVLSFPWVTACTVPDALAQAMESSGGLALESSRKWDGL